MEEILASIRRIIADDEAKPPAAEKAPPPPSPPPASPPPAVAAAPAKPAPSARAPVDSPPAPAPAAPAPPKAAAPTPAPASNSQDDIDALLNGLDEATTPEEIRPAAAEPDVLDLTDEMALPDEPPPQPAFRTVEPPDDLEFTEAAAKAPPREPAFDLPPPSPMDSPPILSRSTVSAVESAFNSLAHTVLSNNHTVLSNNARTLEDLVKEMLRPMLKSWLDDNLPGLVERIVKAEIERVSRGR